MVTATTKAGRFDRATVWRLIAALVLVAFCFQSYVVQTHIHEAHAPVAVAGLHLSHGKAPAGNSPLDCPFCQAVAHGGSFFMPDASLLFLLPQWLWIAVPDVPPVGKSVAINHNWQSRAPPSP
jgi:hypothetical protein